MGCENVLATPDFIAAAIGQQYLNLIEPGLLRAGTGLYYPGGFSIEFLKWWNEGDGEHHLYCVDVSINVKLHTPPVHPEIEQQNTETTGEIPTPEKDQL